MFKLSAITMVLLLPHSLKYTKSDFWQSQWGAGVGRVRTPCPPPPPPPPLDPPMIKVTKSVDREKQIKGAVQGSHLNDMSKRIAKPGLTLEAITDP